MIIELLFQNPLLYFMAAVSITLALTIHEYSHAQAADLLGDSTPRKFGRLTVNPLAHFDPLGALFIFTVGFGWGRPVPFNPFNLKNRRWGPALVGLAGPASNLTAALTVGLILRFVSISNNGLFNFFTYFVWLNILLAVFNLIPIFPLDGSHLLAAFRAPAGIGRNVMAGGSMIQILIAIFFMIYIGSPFIVGPIFRLITGIPAI